MDKNLKIALIIGGILLAVVLIVPNVFWLAWGGQSGDWGMMGPGMMGGFGIMGWMSVIWIAILGLIIWAVVAAVRGTTSSGGDSAGRTDSALEILKKRYARGEINKEEYEEKKRDLS